MDAASPGMKPSLRERETCNANNASHVSTDVNNKDESSEMYESLSVHAPYWVSAMAGALAGISEHIIMYPLDSIKTRMQMIHNNPHASYDGMWHALKKISLQEGTSRLFRGVSSVILGAGPAHALYFGTYEMAKSALGIQGKEGRSPLSTAMAGACATTASDALMTPFDVIKQRMQAHGSVYKNLLDCSTSILRKEGLAAFYISYPTTLLLNVPFQAIQFPVYEICRRTLHPSDAYSPSTHIISGAVAGAIASACTTPLDVMKTLLQTKGTVSLHEIRVANSMVDAARIIFASCGWKGFFRGIGPRVLIHIPSTAVCWAIYEYFKYLISGMEIK